MKLTTLGYTEGFYYRPRIDEELLEKYHEGIIASSACLAGVVSAHIIDGNLDLAREKAAYYKQIFGDDFYLELQNHYLNQDPMILSEVPKIAKELNIKMIVTNDIHYIKKEHAIAHNVLLHIKDTKPDSAEGIDVTKLRYGTPEYYFKTKEEMQKLFFDVPEAIANTVEIADKCDVVFEKKLFMPQFPIPKESKSTNLDEYLEELTYKGLHELFGEITDDVKERVEYELSVIKNMGFPGYFLIVQDFIRASRELGIRVGPGRGSAASSLVAYALGITKVNPFPYDLLFERFLNPERISMPDIDTDFDDINREKAIEYVKQKYGESSVAQIVTFGKLSSKAVLKDVGRVLGIHHSIINEINKKIPVSQGKVTPLKDALELPDLKDVKESQDPKMKQLIDYSLLLEGLYRHTSVHAAGVVIAPDEVWNFVPLYKAPGQKKDSNEKVFADLCTQYTMGQLEDSGLLKMDFLGLKTLSIIDKTLDMIKKNHGIEFDIDKIDFDDDATYDTFGRGDTLAIFQFESKGMQEYLQQLKPKNLEEITAMNALYRPGPMENIPEFIDRKFGRKPITYIHPIMKKSLEKTYGIIVYQEQVMQLVCDVGGFSLGGADILRRAMGKKKLDLMSKQKPIFVEGAKKNDVTEQQAIEIFDLIEKFANYGFNKSHSLAYSFLAYQTAWLKTHYPAEFLAANMSSELNDLNKIVLLIEEAEKLEIKVLPPDVNRSDVGFTAVGNEIYFGLAAIKNVGVGAVESIIEARKKGLFTGFFDFVRRVDSKAVNRRSLESLICAGAFDSLQSGHRASLMLTIDSALDYAKACQQSNESTMDSLFGGSAVENLTEPALVTVKEWSDKERLENEKNVLNFYISGHPLNQFRNYVYAISTLKLDELESPKIGEKVRACGILSSINRRKDRKDNDIAFAKIEDFNGNGELIFWSDSFAKFKGLLYEDSPVMAFGKSELDGEKIRITVEDLMSIQEAAEAMYKGLFISVDLDDFDTNKLNEFKKLCKYEDFKSTIIFSLYSKEKNYKSKWIAYNVSLKFSDDIFQSLSILFGKNNVGFMCG